MPTFHPYVIETLAETVHDRLESAAAARGVATLAIPGGRTPGPLLTALAGMCTGFLRARLHLFWVDERAVPVGHADRNDAATLTAWAEGGALPAHVHPMPAEVSDLDLAATAYAADLAQACGQGPVDVAVIGIGEDGHMASLFPGHEGLDELDPVFAVTDSPKPPPRRLTMSLGVLRQARHKIVIALGAVKGDVARSALSGPDRQLPVSLLGDSGVEWYLDDAALEAANG